MRNNEERITELHSRMEALKKAKVGRQYVAVSAAVYAVCLAVVILAASGFSNQPVLPRDAGSGSVTGSIFAGNETLAYIAVILIALCLGVLVTIFCFRLKKHMEKEKK